MNLHNNSTPKAAIFKKSEVTKQMHNNQLKLNLNNYKVIHNQVTSPTNTNKSK